MQRVPEPELMDNPRQALAYARADFSEPHDHFVSLFARCCGDPGDATVLDLGCGPGDICRRFARAWPDCRIHALDASAPMLALARDDTRATGLQARIDYFQGHLPDVAPPAPPYAVIISNSLLHHLQDPSTLWRSLKRYSQPGARIFIMDLMRPATRERAAELVDAYATGEPDILREDFYHSLCAAYTPGEVSAQLQAQGLAGLAVEAISDRHFIVHGRSSAA